MVCEEKKILGPIRRGTEVSDDDQAMASETPLEPGPTQENSAWKKTWTLW